MRIKVEFEVEVPFDVTDPEHIDEWISFECSDCPGMSMKNPLCGMPAEPVMGTFGWEAI